MTPQELVERLGLSYQEKSNRLQMLCPFHQDKNPSSGFYLDTQKFFCFSCELSLDLVGFYAKFKETTRTIAARDLGLDPDPVLKYDKTVADTVRIRAERKLIKSLYLPRKVHAAFGERLDHIMWLYAEARISNEELDLAMIRWYKDLEGTLEHTQELESNTAGTAGSSSDGGIKEGSGNLSRNRPEATGLDLETSQPEVPDSILDVLE